MARTLMAEINWKDLIELENTKHITPLVSRETEIAPYGHVGSKTTFWW
jgi:hypothetical protein